MSERNTVVRSLHDLGLAAWFGGSLAGAVAVNGAARAQQQLGTCQWLIPTLTGGISVLSALQGEQQRPTQQMSGILAKPRGWLRAAA